MTIVKQSVKRYLMFQILEDKIKIRRSQFLIEENNYICYQDSKLLNRHQVKLYSSQEDSTSILGL